MSTCNNLCKCNRQVAYVHAGLHVPTVVQSRMQCIIAKSTDNACTVTVAHDANSLYFVNGYFARSNLLWHIIILFEFDSIQWTFKRLKKLSFYQLDIQILHVHVCSACVRYFEHAHTRRPYMHSYIHWVGLHTWVHKYKHIFIPTYTNACIFQYRVARVF